MNRDTLISWKALEHQRGRKGLDWYAALTIITIALIIMGIITNNVLFSLVITLASITLALFANRRPKRQTYSITETSIHIGRSVYPHKSLHSFTITDDAPPRLLIRSRNFSVGHLIIPVEEADPRVVTKVLGRFVTKEDFTEPLSVTVMEWLGF